MHTKIRAFVLILTSIAVTASGLLFSAGTSNAATANAATSPHASVHPSWDQSVCPANAWAPGDIYCYQASDPLSWVRFHVFYDPTTGHDAAWANGYVGQSNLHGNICVADSLTGAFQCVGENGGTGQGVQTGSIPDGPANLDFGELDFYDASNALVAVYHTQGF